MRSRLTTLLFALIALGALAGSYAAWKRYEVEGLNRRVELALEYAEVRQVAQLTGQPIDAVLARFKGAGITSLSITEETLTGLEAHGDLRVQPGGRIITASSPQVLDRIRAALLAKGLAVSNGAQQEGDTLFTMAADQAPASAGGAATAAPPAFLVHADYSILRPLGIGLDPDSVAAAHRAGLYVVGRINNFVGASPATMANVLTALKQDGVQTVIFQGLEVLGFRGGEKEAVAALEQTGLYYGQVEFGKQKGDETLGIALKGKFVRVHSVSDTELGTMDENEAIERFVRAARERNIRLCYVRLVTLAGADPVGANVEFLRKVTKGIERGSRHEMEFGPAHPFEEVAVSRAVFGVIALGVAAGATLLLVAFAPVSDRAAWGTLAVAAVCCVGAAMLLGESGRKLVALLAALVFPTLACLRRDVLDGAARNSGTVSSSVSANGHGKATDDHAGAPSRGAAAAFAVRGIAAASAVTSLGILSVVGLMASRSFMVKANQFLGIKAAHAVPILLIGALAITGVPRLESAWPRERDRMRARLRAFFAEPTRVGQLLLAVVALVALAMIVARTGNDPGVGVSGVELKFRSLLDRLLPVRPRTKEFLVGHPAFVIALALWFRGHKKIAVPLFVVGVIGQVSILNTFCHAHTPLHLSLIRDVTGLVFGSVIGLALFWVLDRLLPARGDARPRAEESAAAPSSVERRDPGLAGASAVRASETVPMSKPLADV